MVGRSRKSGAAAVDGAGGRKAISTSARRGSVERRAEPSWQDAISFAARAHRGQHRRDAKTPYVAHPARVMMIVRHLFECDDAEAICAAVLHDTIEDTTTDYDDLMQRFGAGVAELVAALTKNMALPNTRREAEYDVRLAAADWRARLIKLADVYDNLCDLSTLEGTTVAERRRKAIEKAERAISLAAEDGREHAPIARALEEVRRKIRGV